MEENKNKEMTVEEVYKKVEDALEEIRELADSNKFDFIGILHKRQEQGKVSELVVGNARVLEVMTLNLINTIFKASKEELGRAFFLNSLRCLVEKLERDNKQKQGG